MRWMALDTILLEASLAWGEFEANLTWGQPCLWGYCLRRPNLRQSWLRLKLIKVVLFNVNWLQMAWLQTTWFNIIVFGDPCSTIPLFDAILIISTLLVEILHKVNPLKATSLVSQTSFQVFLLKIKPCSRKKSAKETMTLLKLILLRYMIVGINLLST